MKYFAQTLFNATTMSSANTSTTSDQFSIGESSQLWLQVSATSANTSTDVSVQLQVSNDPLAKNQSDSNWVNEGSAATYAGTSFFDKHRDLGAEKGRVILTRNAGSGVMTVRGVGKAIV